MRGRPGPVIGERSYAGADDDELGKQGNIDDHPDNDDKNLSGYGLKFNQLED
jgi:hypothetical protein